jgi:subtilisin family serine protease
MRQFVPALAVLCAALGALVAAAASRRGAWRSIAPALAVWVTVIAIVGSVLAPSAAVITRRSAAQPRTGAAQPLAAQRVLAATSEREHPSDPGEARISTVRAATRAAPAPRIERKPPAKRRAEPDTFLVAFSNDVSPAAQRDAVVDAGGTVTGEIPELDTLVVSATGGARSAPAKRLQSDERVERTEANLIRSASEDPSDEFLPYQAGVYSTRLPAAWDVTHGSTNIDIAILDTGVDTTHPDLSGRIVPGRNFISLGTNVTDDEGHGTFVAGIAAAKTGNSTGIAGAAWNARIIPVKVLDSEGLGDDAGIAAGIIWATDHGAEIINMSLGGPGSTTTLRNAVDYAIAHNVVVVAAAGNEGNYQGDYPASYPAVISVGATDDHGDVTYFSNRNFWLDVVAPGWDVLSTLPRSIVPGGYGVASGTSFSAPVVSGVAALVKARSSSLTPAQIQSRIKLTAIDRGPAGLDEFYGSGLVDAYAAVGGRKAAPAPAALRDQFEPDGTADSARPIALGGGTTGTFSPEGDIDWFAVTTTEVGALRITVTPPTVDDGSLAQSIDPMITAFDAGLEFRETYNQFPPGSPESHQVAAATPGTYYFRASSAASSRSTGVPTAPDAYTVTTSFTPTQYVENNQTRMWVRDMDPAPFSTDVPADVHPSATFARDVTEQSAESSLTFRDMTADTYVTATRDWDPATRTVTATPSEPLKAGHSYEMFVNGAHDEVSSYVPENQYDFAVTRFTVAAPPKPVDLRSDFNKDGFDDTVIGAPGEDHGTTKTDGGVVHVLYGSASGPRGVGSQMWSQDSSGIADAVEAGDRFGEATTTGDLNNDGYDDLVVGAPYEDVGSIKDAGMIHVLLGSPSGLRSTGSTIWTSDSPSVPGNAEPADRFGATLAAGRFDASPGSDLAIGSPGEAVGSAAKAGAVHVVRGASGGLTSSGAVQWTQDSAGIDFLAEAGDAFGASLASGDFQGDGHDDLAIGAPSDNVVDADEGSVMLMRGSIVGMRPSGLFFDVFSEDGPEAGDRYGASVAIADLGGYRPTDGYGDLVVGLPGENDLLLTQAGSVDVIYSDHSDPWFSSTRITAPSDGLLAARQNAFVGTSLAARTFGTDGTLAIGLPFGVGTNTQAPGSGAALVFRTGSGLLANGLFGPHGSRVIDQELAGLADDSETSDRFAADVALLDTDGDAKADLIAGAPFESVGSLAAAGAVSVVLDAGGSATTAMQFSQDTPGVGSAAEATDRFGASVG